MEYAVITPEDILRYDIEAALDLLVDYPKIIKDVLNGKTFACSFERPDGSFVCIVDFETPLKGMDLKDFEEHAWWLWAIYSSIPYWYEV